MAQTGRYHVPMVFAALLAGGLAAGEASAQAAPPTAQPGGKPAKPAAAPPSSSAAASAAPAAPAPPQPVRTLGRSQRGEVFYARRFGVDQLHVRSTASGASVEFRYRVVDVEKAKVLTDKRNTPRLIDVATGTVLSVPTMDKIGELRQTPPPEVGREYWMVFSNPGKRVKPGQRVNIKIGAFRAEGLVVE
jgi:hypothetical protein